MIRRNASGFRALLMGADALTAVVLLAGLSLWRFGDDWAIWWRQIVPIPEGLLVIYAGGWVIALTMNGLYRPRARCSGSTRGQARPSCSQPWSGTAIS